MAWNDNRQLDLQIITADDKVYIPDYIRPKLLQQWQMAEFSFIGIEGTLIDRNAAKGRRFRMEIIFQGDDHLDVSNEFRISADINSKPWLMTVPEYGQVRVQPIELEYDNENLNMTLVRATLAETIEGGAIRPGLDNVAKAQGDFQALTQVWDDGTIGAIPEPTLSDVQVLSAQMQSFFDGISGQITDAVDFSTFTNTYLELQTFINRTTFNINELVGQCSNVLAVPATLAVSAVERVRLIAGVLGSMLNVGKSSKRSERLLYEHNAGIGVGALCVGALVEPRYSSAVEVLQVLDNVVAQYNGYVDRINELMDDTGAVAGNYTPSSDALRRLTGLVNFTVGALWELARESKQVRSVVLTEDSNVLLLTHKYYGVDADDVNVELLMRSNSIGLEELLLIPQGRRIVYYV